MDGAKVNNGFKMKIGANTKVNSLVIIFSRFIITMMTVSVAKKSQQRRCQEWFTGGLSSF